MRPRLRLFTGDDGVCEMPKPQVTISLGEFARILSDATWHDRTWVADLADDPVKVSADLYEILAAYSHLRPSA